MNHFAKAARIVLAVLREIFDEAICVRLRKRA